MGALSLLHPPVSAQTQRRLGGQTQGWKMLPAFLDIFRQGETHPHQLPHHLCSLEGTLRPKPVPSAYQSGKAKLQHGAAQLGLPVKRHRCVPHLGIPGTSGLPLLFYSITGLRKRKAKAAESHHVHKDLCCGLAQHGFRQRTWRPGQVNVTTEWEGLLRGPGWQVL